MYLLHPWYSGPKRIEKKNKKNTNSNKIRINLIISLLMNPLLVIYGDTKKYDFQNDQRAQNYYTAVYRISSKKKPINLSAIIYFCYTSFIKSTH